MLEEVFALPERQERDYLLAGLARLIHQQGPEHFLSAPLLLPQPEFWPEPVATRGQGAATLLRRLLAYAGLAELGVDVEIGAARPPDLVDDETDPAHHAVGWFKGIEADVCYFGVSSSSLRDEESLIGTLGHEVAHAYRDYHGLVVIDRDIEEKLTDLTTVYLGFGFFTLQSSFQFKTGHYDDQGRRLLYERQTLGYLTPGQLALLLAAQLVVRSHGQEELTASLSSLAPNHARALRRAYKDLEPERDSLIEELGLPPAEQWPERQPLGHHTRPLGPATIVVVDHAAEDRRSTDDEIAFRVSGNLRTLGGASGIFLGFCTFVIDGVGGWMWPLTLFFCVTGYKLGRRISRTVCSTCQHRVKTAQPTCPSCGARLVGAIDHVADRLDAEERYRAGHATRIAARPFGE